MVVDSRDAPPALAWYEGRHLDRLALPLGGIGTGTVSIGGRGQLCDFEMVNRPLKGVTPADCLLALRTRDGSGRVAYRVLEGPIPRSEFAGAFGARAPNAGLPRFERARCGCAYPFAQVELEDPAIPLAVRLDAWNPLAPVDVDASSWPVAALRVVLANPGSAPCCVSAHSEAEALQLRRSWIH